MPADTGARAARRLTLAVSTGLALLLAQTPSGAVPAAAPVVDVRAAAGGGEVRASVDVDAPPEVVWRVMTDPASASKLLAGARSVRVLSRDPSGRWDVREQVSQGGVFPAIRVVLRSEYDAPRTVRFQRVGGDLTALEGEWRLSPLDGGARTRVDYETRLAAAAPGVIVRAALRRSVPLTLANLREASQSAARREAAGPSDRQRPVASARAAG